MDRRKQAVCNGKKKERRIDRKMNTALFLLRCIQAGLSMSDLEEMSMGMVFDIFTENQNDKYKYPLIATQEDIDAL